MKKYITDGSALLVVVLVTSAIVICTNIVWQGTAFLSDLVLKRQEYEQKYRFTEGVLNYGIAFCKCNYDAIQNATTKGKETFTITLDEDKISPHQTYSGKIYVTVQDNATEYTSGIRQNQQSSLRQGFGGRHAFNPFSQKLQSSPRLRQTGQGKAKAGKSIQLKAVLVDNKKEVFTLGCNLSKQQFLKNSVEKKYDTKLLVQNFTILPK